MQIADFLSPVDLQKLTPEAGFLPAQLGSQIRTYTEAFPDLENVDIAIFAVNETRTTPENTHFEKGIAAIRKELYALYTGNFNPRIIDIGTIEQGNTIKDTYVAVKIIVDELISRKIVPILIGGSHDITYAQYTAYQSAERNIDLVVLDRLLDLRIDEETTSAITPNNYLTHIITHQPGYLFNFSNVGYQTYFNDQAALRIVEKLYFDAYRLGAVRQNINEIEPVIRDGDLLSIDISSIKMSDAPGSVHATPNGFTAEEICQLCKYAGASDKLTSFGLYEYSFKHDVRNQTAMLIAQMMWCFIDGYYLRKNEQPLIDKQAFIRYAIATKKGDYELVFYKSKATDKWWMQIPSPRNTANERSYLVACSYADYQTACDGELPDRWWRMQQKLL